MHSCPLAVLQVLVSRDATSSSDATVLCSLSRTLCVTLLSLASSPARELVPAARRLRPTRRPGLPFPSGLWGLLSGSVPFNRNRMGATPVILNLLVTISKRR